MTTLDMTKNIAYMHICQVITSANYSIIYFCYHLIEARVSRSFDEMVDFALVEVDFDDPTTNVRGRRALAIAKPTPRGY